MNREATQRSAWRTYLTVVLLALLVRAYLCANLPCISRDGVHFVTFARQLDDEPMRWMRLTTKQPGFSWLLLAVHDSVGWILSAAGPMAWQRSGQLIAAVGGAIACGLIALLARRLFDMTTAIVAGLLAAFWWQGAELSADVLSEMPHLALYLGVLVIGLAAIKGKRSGSLAVCGAVAGLAYLLRQEAVGIVGAVGICWLWPGLGLKARQRWMGAIMLALFFAAMVAPYALAVGKIMPNKSLYDLLQGAPPPSAGVSGPPILLAHVIPWWMAPGRMAEAWAKSGRYTMAALVLAALFRKTAPRAEGTGRRLVLAAVLFQIMLVQVRVQTYGEISTRYMVIPAALSIPWAASGLLALLTIVIRRLPSAGTARTALICAAGIALALAPQVYYLERNIRGGRHHVRDAGQWLLANTPGEDRVLAGVRQEQLLFYAGRTWPDQTWAQLPEAASPGEVRAHIEKFRPRWFVLVASGRRDRPNQSGSLDSSEVVTMPELQKEWTTGPPGGGATVFRVVESAPPGSAAP